ncbi:MAG: helix-hairpin-helix domain-containing protein [Bryocella sp.]
MKIFRTLLAIAVFSCTMIVARPAAMAQPPAASAPAAALVDINTATKDQLKALPGIGDAYADKIIKARPYANKSQLVSKSVLPKGVYNKVSGMIIANKK